MQQFKYEYDSVDSSLRYVQDQWRRQNLSLPIQSVNPEDLTRAIQDLQNGYFIRLFSTFEGILKEHMAQHHPSIVLEEDVRAVWLIDRVAQRQSPPMTLPLRNRVHEVRRYRNFLAHPSGLVPVETSFSTAIFRLSNFIDYLPEPR